MRDLWFAVVSLVGAYHATQVYNAYGLAAGILAAFFIMFFNVSMRVALWLFQIMKK